MEWLDERCRELGPDGIAADHVRDRRPAHGRRRRSSTTSRATGARAPCASATAPCQQLQLDIYGELMDSVYLYNKYGSPICDDLWQHLRRLTNWVCDHWNGDGRGHLGGARRAAPLRLLQADVLGGRGPRHAPRPASARFPPTWQRWIEVRDQIYDDIMKQRLERGAAGLRAVLRQRQPGRRRSS